MASKCEESFVDMDPAAEASSDKVAEDESELELHRAVFHGDLDGAEAALERGANASIQDRHGVCLIRRWFGRRACDTHNLTCSIQIQNTYSLHMLFTS